MSSVYASKSRSFFVAMLSRSHWDYKPSSGGNAHAMNVGLITLYSGERKLETLPFRSHMEKKRLNEIN